VTRNEILRVERYLQTKFRNTDIALRQDPQLKGALEVCLGDEFIGTLYRDDDEGEISYAFSMVILELDVPRSL
jgi:hypothetical protein